MGREMTPSRPKRFPVLVLAALLLVALVAGFLQWWPSYRRARLEWERVKAPGDDPAAPSSSGSIDATATAAPSASVGPEL